MKRTVADAIIIYEDDINTNYEADLTFTLDNKKERYKRHIISTQKV
jgi:hypothetical protein